MSDIPKTAEETPAVFASDPVSAPESSDLSKTAMAAPEAENTDISSYPDEASKTIVGGEPTAVSGAETTEELAKKGEVAVEATPASEGVLGYKAQGLLKSLRFSKYYFWFGDEALKPEHLAHYIRSEKNTDVAHQNASWAQESGKGVLFFSKRSEDKATPTGLIMLADASNVVKEGSDEFQFKTGNHTHKFQAANSEEQAAWIVAIEKKAEEAKEAKESIVGSEGYKKNLDGYKAIPAVVGMGSTAINAPKTEPKKSLDASTGIAAATTADGVHHDDAAVSEEEKKDAAKSKKDRSQSRKRASIFGSLLGKKEDTEEKKEVKKEEKADEKVEKKEAKKEEKIEKKEVKEEKKAEAVQKKDEAKAAHDSSKATEAAEAAAVAAVPAAAIAIEKHDKKEEDKTGTTTPTDKKAKRGSVFGAFFGKKNATSSDGEKTEGEAAPTVPVKDSDVPPVSETAPKIEKPVEQKPIDAAVVTAPVDTVTTPAAVEEPVSEPATAPAETATTPKTEKKGGILGFIKKQEAKFESKKDQKDEVKEEKAADKIAKDPVAAASSEPATETSAPPPNSSEERPVRDKRRSSFFSGLGTQRKKNLPEGSSEADAEAPVETKRERSPLPGKLGGLFRRPSKAAKSAEEKSAAATDGTMASTIPESKDTTASKTIDEPSVTVPEHHNPVIAGDVGTDHLESSVHDAVTKVPAEVSASA